MNQNTSKINLTQPDKITTFLSKNNLSVQIVFIKKEENDHVSSYMSVDKNSIENIRKISSNFISEKNTWDVFEYGANLDNEKKIGIYRTIDINQVPKRKHILKKPTKIEKKITKTLIATTILIGFRFELPNQKPVMFLKKTNRNYFVLNNHGFFASVISGVAKLTKDDLFKLPDKFDLVTYGDDLLIFSPKMFENFFGFFEIYKENKDEVFTHLRNSIDYKIDGLDDVETEIDSPSSPRFLRKFLAIKEKKIYTQKFVDLKKILKIRPIPTVKVIGNTLKFEGTQAFIDFYNDNYLSSHFTKKKYTVHSKTEE